MSSIGLTLAAEISSARAALRSASPGSAADLCAAVNHAEHCLADLSRAEVLLASESASARAALAALQRAAAAEAADLAARKKGGAL